MKTKFDAAVGQNIKILRVKNRLTQIDLANIMGIHQAGVSRIEDGRQTITFCQILKLAKAFNLTINDFLDGATF